MNIGAFLSWLQCVGYSTETLTAYKSDLEMLDRFLVARHLRSDRVTLKAVDEFVRFMAVDKRLAPSTIGRRLAAVSSFFDYQAARSNGRMRNPLRGLRRPRRRPPGPQPVDEYSLTKLLEGIDDARDLTLVELFVRSGLRISELHRLNRDSIRVEQKVRADGIVMTLGVGEVLGKGGKRRM